MLLVVALVATILLWRSLVCTRERLDWLDQLRAELREAESKRNEALFWYDFDRKGGPVDADLSDDLEKTEAKVNSLEQQITELSQP
jgi:hypothetical protein